MQEVLSMRTKKIVVLLTGISFLLWACKAQEGLPSQEKLPRVDNVHFSQKADTVNIFYDLYAKSPDDRFNIKLMLSLGENKTYEIDQTSTDGAIGEGVLPGTKKQITWDVLEDFPKGVQGKQIQFIVDARQLNSSDNNRKWLYITSGALILGASAVLGFLYLQSGESGLPSPPSRPGGN